MKTKRIYTYEYNGNIDIDFPCRFSTCNTYCADFINDFSKYCIDNYIVSTFYYHSNGGNYTEFYFKNNKDLLLAKLIFK
jgi:hypothetical protein